jgi:hypothetical protein
VPVTARRFGPGSAALAAVVLTLLVALAARQLAGPAAGAERRQRLGVGEELWLDPAGTLRWRWLALADIQGRRTLIFHRLGPEATQPTYRLTEGVPLHADGREVRLTDLAIDRSRGSAIECQWIPRDTTAPRPWFSVTEEPGTFPVGEESTIRVVGPIPPPGPGTTAVEIVRAGRDPVVLPVTRGARVPLGTDGELAWLGTRERWEAGVSIRPR